MERIELPTWRLTELISAARPTARIAMNPFKNLLEPSHSG